MDDTIKLAESPKVPSVRPVPDSKLISLVYCHRCQTRTILVNDCVCWKCHSSDVEVIRK